MILSLHLEMAIYQGFLRIMTTTNIIVNEVKDHVSYSYACFYITSLRGVWDYCKIQMDRILTVLFWIGWTSALCNGQWSKSLDVVELLLSYGADVNAAGYVRQSIHCRWIVDFIIRGKCSSPWQAFMQMNEWKRQILLHCSYRPC